MDTSAVGVAEQQPNISGNDKKPTAAVIRGSLNAVIDEDSDDSESDEDNIPTVAPLNLAASHNDDSDVELEVNEELVSSLPPVPKPRQSQNSNSLLDAMNDAIIETETGGSNEKSTMVMPPPAPAVRNIEGFSTRPKEVPKEKPKVPKPSTADDTFGISFKERKPTNNNTTATVPPPAFEEDEFEELEVQADSSMKTMNEAGDDDDEFEVDSVNATTASFSVEETRAKLQQDALEREQQLVESLKKETADEKQQSSYDKEPTTTTSTTTSINIKTEASKALSDMHDVYSKGLGDQGILSSESTTAEVPSITGMSSVIEEGDEEEEERLEAEEDLKEKEEEELRKATEDAWNNVETSAAAAAVTIEESSNTTRGDKISYSTALSHFKSSSYVKDHLGHIVPYEPPPSGGCFSCLRLPKQLNFSNAIAQRDLIFCIAKVSFDDTVEEHHRILQSIYKSLIGTTRDCPTSGAHWIDVGFQGNDPSTDLRGVGMLGLLQLLHFVTTSKDVATKLYKFSTDETYHFPLACVSFNITLKALECLRAGSLIGLCNTYENCFKALNTLHGCIFYNLYASFKERAGQEEFPIVMQRVLDSGKNNPVPTVNEWKGFLKSGSSTTTSTTNDEAKFTDLEGKES